MIRAPIVRVAVPRVVGLAFSITGTLACALNAVGCRGCREDHPFVPYAIGSAAPAPPAEGGTGPSGPNGIIARAGVDGGPGFDGQNAEIAPPSLSRWALGDVTMTAPDAAVFALGVRGDFDGDGSSDAFAIVRHADGNDPGELVFYRAEGVADSGQTTPSRDLTAVTTFAPPTGLARDATCTPIDRLVRVGAHAVLVELGSSCPSLAVRAPTRWAAIVNVGRGATIKLAATIADPVGAPTLTLDAAVADRDGDGRDDVTLRVALEGGGPPFEPARRVSATFAWVDRPAGLSRDMGATESAFAALASWVRSRAGHARDAPEVPSDVAQVRALWRATCAEGGAPRVVAVAGTGTIQCGSGKALEDAGLAEVRAYATMGDPLRAALALDRAEHPPASHTASRVAEAKRWIADRVSTALARTVRAVAAVPMPSRGLEPAWGALAFEPSGKLLVRTRAGVVRVDPNEGDETDAGIPPWKAEVVSPQGELRWIEAYDPCNGLPLRATFELASGDDSRDIALPVAPLLEGRCVGTRASPVRGTPLSFGPGGLEAIVEGQLVLVSLDLAHASLLSSFLVQPVTPGAPRSPDGKTYVVPTSSGLIVRSESRTRLFRAPELDGSYGDLRDCAVSDDGVHVACVHEARAWLGTWEERGP